MGRAARTVACRVGRRLRGWPTHGRGSPPDRSVDSSWGAPSQLLRDRGPRRATAEVRHRLAGAGRYRYHAALRRAVARLASSDHLTPGSSRASGASIRPTARSRSGGIGWDRRVAGCFLGAGGCWWRSAERCFCSPPAGAAGAGGGALGVGRLWGGAGGGAEGVGPPGVSAHRMWAWCVQQDARTRPFSGGRRRLRPSAPARCQLRAPNPCRRAPNPLRARRRCCRRVGCRFGALAGCRFGRRRVPSRSRRARVCLGRRVPSRSRRARSGLGRRVRFRFGLGRRVPSRSRRARFGLGRWVRCRSRRRRARFSRRARFGLGRRARSRRRVRFGLGRRARCRRRVRSRRRPVRSRPRRCFLYAGWSGGRR